jgi:hypothetical protein
MGTYPVPEILRFNILKIAGQWMKFGNCLVKTDDCSAHFLQKNAEILV